MQLEAAKCIEKTIMVSKIIPIGWQPPNTDVGGTVSGGTWQQQTRWAAADSPWRSSRAKSTQRQMHRKLKIRANNPGAESAKFINISFLNPLQMERMNMASFLFFARELFIIYVKIVINDCPLFMAQQELPVKSGNSKRGSARKILRTR